MSYEKQNYLYNKNIIAYICLVHFLINVKQMNCKTESYFVIMFSMVGHIWIHVGLHAVGLEEQDDAKMRRCAAALNVMRNWTSVG